MRALILRGVSEATTISELHALLASADSILPSVRDRPVASFRLFFSPVFITPDVLLASQDRQQLQPTQTLGAAQVIDDDIIYLALE